MAVDIAARLNSNHSFHDALGDIAELPESDADGRMLIAKSAGCQRIVSKLLNFQHPGPRDLELICKCANALGCIAAAPQAAAHIVKSCARCERPALLNSRASDRSRRAQRAVENGAIRAFVLARRCRVRPRMARACAGSALVPAPARARGAIGRRAGFAAGEQC